MTPLCLFQRNGRALTDTVGSQWGLPGSSSPKLTRSLLPLQFQFGLSHLVYPGVSVSVQVLSLLRALPFGAPGLFPAPELTNVQRFRGGLVFIFLQTLCML